MKIIKLSLAALVVIVAAATSAFKTQPKATFFSPTYFKYSGSQTAAGYNTIANYTKESSPSCSSNDPILCEIAVTAITHTSLGVKTIPVLPLGTGTAISGLNDAGTKNVPSGSYLIGGTSVVLDFKI